VYQFALDRGILFRCPATPKLWRKKMASKSMTTFMHQLRQSVLAGDGAGLTDAQLLSLFVERRDEGAFEALVRRHGPMVMGVCGRILHNPHDAEDAFQATFLVLARKATSIVPREKVPNWLHGVACMTARRAKIATGKRRGRERQVTQMPEPQRLQQDLWHELQPLLDEELGRLPDKYRILIVLCDLQGKTRKEAAQDLGVPEGTVAGRLARARNMLAKRLARHGLAVSGAALTAVLSQNVLSAAVPTSLVSSTVQAVSVYAAGQAAGVISVKVATLTEGVMKTMLLSKLKIATAVLALLLVPVAGTGVGLWAHGALASNPSEEQRGKAERTARRPEPERPVTPEPVAQKEIQAVRATQAETAVPANENKANAHAAQTEQREQEAKNEPAQVRALNEKLRLTVYASDMSHAQHAWEAGGAAALVRDLLERHVPRAGETDLRDFEWHYLNRLCHAELLTLRHTGGPTCVAFSPDGKRIASGSMVFSSGPQGGAVKVWDAQTGRELLSFKAYTGGLGIVSLAFSPDGKRLATACEGPRNPVKVWDAQTGQEVLSVPGFFKSVAFSPDGKRLATGEKVWDAQTGKEVLTLNGSGFCTSVAFSPDGIGLAGGSDEGRLKVWDAQTGQELLLHKGHSDEVRSLAFSPDGKRLASASDDHTAIVWDAQTGKELLSLKQAAGGVSRVAFSPDGKRLAGGSFDNGVKVWDTQTGQELLACSGHDEEVFGLAFSPDGKRLASAGDNTAKVWDAQTMQKPLSLQGGVASVAYMAFRFSPDGRRLAGGKEDGNAVKVWDTQPARNSSPSREPSPRLPP
jgi:RNA polymerase sigma factor (sigma-70 family)